MNNYFATFIVGLMMIFGISTANSQTVNFTVPNSPNLLTAYSNTLQDLNWTTFQRTDVGIISSVTVAFEWETDGWPTEGTFRLRHPDMTVTNLITAGVTNNAITINASTTTPFNLVTNAFNGKAIAGEWALWIEDSFADGGHEARNISITINYTTPPMTYTSCTALQITNAVAPGTERAPVIALRVVMNGVLSLLNTNSITFSTSGTTDSTDLLNARVYYTGNSALFDTTTSFGTLVANPSGTFTITGSQNLMHGNNHFWLCYDIDSSAQQANLIDAECLSVTVDSIPRVPTITAPVGARRVIHPFIGDYNVGTGNFYTTLGSLFADMNNVGLLGHTNVFITSNLTEPSQVLLLEPPIGNQYTVILRPAAGISPTVTSTHNGQSMLISGFDNLFINGSNSTTSNTRDLTFINNGTSTVSHGFFIQESDNITLRNIIIQNSSSNNGACVVISTANNISVNNCKLFKANNGIVVQNNSQYINILNNEFGSLTIGNSLSASGITFAAGAGFTTSCDNFQISNNIFDGIVFTGATGAWQTAVSLFNGYNGVVERNILKNIYNTGGHIIGFRLGANEATPPSSQNIVIKNNVMTNFNVSTSTGNMFAFYTTNTQNVKILHNTMNFGSGSQGFIVIGNRWQIGCQNISYNNNIMIVQPAQSTLRYMHYIDNTQTNNPFSSLNNNIYQLAAGSNFAFQGAADRATLALWSTALGGGPTDSDLNSFMKVPIFASVGAPYLAGSVLNDADYIVPLHTDVFEDIDMETRTANNNFAGADILVPSAINFTNDLPASRETARNVALSAAVTPQISSSFEDGITRTPPTGDLPAMTYTWFHNDTPIVSGVNNFISLRNLLTITSADSTHVGNYYCLVDFNGVYGVSNTMALSVVDVPKPILTSPADNAQNIPLALMFSWQSVATATSYNLQVANSETFANLIIDTTLSSTDAIVTGLNNFTNYYWRVKASNLTHQSQWSEVRTFKTIAPPIAPPSLVYPLNTATNVSINPTIVWNTFPSATGYTLEISTDNTFTTTFLTETLTDTSKAVTALATLTEYFWRVRTHRTVEQSTWSEVRSFTTEIGSITQTIPLTSGWNMFSANVTPQNPAMSNILTPLLGNMMLIKNVYGQVFAPPFQASLTNWNTSHAYQARMTTPANLVLEGAPIVPEMTPLTLDQLGWYWLPYYRTSSMPVGNALATIQGKYLQIKSITGQVHQPPFITTLQNLEPNMGYMIRMSATDGTLTYPSNAIIKAGSDPVHIPQPKVFVRDAAVTGKTAVIALELDNMQNGDEVGVFTRDGLLVGSSVWANGSRGVVVWGDDEYTNEKDGAAEGEELIVKIWSAEANNIGKVESISLNDMTTNARQFTLTYETDAVYLLKGTADVAEAAKLSISPQPASYELFVNIPYLQDMEYLNQIASVKLYSQAGQLALGLETEANGLIKLNTSTLSSGVYQMIININGKTYSEKVVIVK